MTRQAAATPIRSESGATAPSVGDRGLRCCDDAVIVAHCDNPRVKPARLPLVHTGPAVGSLPDLFAPTNNPGEHLMTGVNAGPGAGSEALPSTLPITPQMTALGLLNSLGDNVSPFVASIRNHLAAQAQNDMPH